MAVTLTGTVTSSCCLPSHKTSSLGLTRSRRSITSPTHGRLSSVMLPMRTNIHSSFSQISASTSSNREAVRSDSNQNMKTPLPFTKYHGLGNDFILVDNRDSTEPKVTPEQAIKLCDRNFGVGADGVIFAMRAINGTDYVMRIFNSDGSEPEMCGNGIRCMACFVAELENSSRPRSYTIETGAGLIVPKLLEDGKVMVDMGEPKLHPADIPTKLEGQKNDMVVKAELFVNNKIWMATCVSMGNPHCVIFSAKNSEELDISSLSLKDIGPFFEHHDMFPARTNTEFVEVLSASHLRMRVWERGAGETLACGTGACAVVVAAVLEGRSERKCLVDLPGGPLEIEWNKNDNHVYMTGPAEKVFSGTAFL